MGAMSLMYFKQFWNNEHFIEIPSILCMLISSLSIILSGVVYMSIVPHHRVFLHCKKQRECKLSMPLLPNCSVKSKRAKTDGVLAVVALWVTRSKFMVNIPVFLCSQSLKLHEGLCYPKLSRSTYCSWPCNHKFLPAIEP